MLKFHQIRQEWIIFFSGGLLHPCYMSSCRTDIHYRKHAQTSIFFSFGLGYF